MILIEFLTMSNITVSVSTDNVVMQEYSESPGQTMSDLMSALATIKTRTNEYLTELVEASKSQAKAGTGTVSIKYY